jgi:hypothetical protein
LEVAFSFQAVDDLGKALFDGFLLRVDHCFGVKGLLVGVGDACEILNFAAQSLLV